MHLIILLLFILVPYFLPAIVAHARKHPRAPAITLLNLLLGWSVIGWVVALIWALKPLPPSAFVVQHLATPPMAKLCPACGHPAAGAYCGNCGAPLAL